MQKREEVRRKQLKRCQKVLATLKLKLNADKSRLEDAILLVEQREAKILIFEAAIARLEPSHPYYKNDKYRCTYCHKPIKEGSYNCPYCGQEFTWDENVKPILRHMDESDPIKETDKIIKEILKDHESKD